MTMDMKRVNRSAKTWAAQVQLISLALIAVPVAIARGSDLLHQPLLLQIPMALGALIQLPGAIAFAIFYASVGAYFIPEGNIVVLIPLAIFFVANWYFYYRVARWMILRHEGRPT